MKKDVCEKKNAMNMSEKSETKSVMNDLNIDQKNVIDEIVNIDMRIFDNVDKFTKLSQQEFGTLFYRIETTLKK